MIGRRRYRRMLQAPHCRGLSPHARGPPQWAAPPAQLKAFSSQPYMRKVWHEPRYIAASGTQGARAPIFSGKRPPGIPAPLAARGRQVSRWEFS